MSPQFFNTERKQFGLWTALKRLAGRRHVLPLLGYLLLAAVTIYSLQASHDNLQRAFRDSCQRNNTVRISIQRVFDDELRVADQRYSVGKISAERYWSEVQFAIREQRRVSPVDCTVVSKP